jgi:hypothetical protein
MRGHDPIHLPLQAIGIVEARWSSSPITSTTTTPARRRFPERSNDADDHQFGARRLAD